MNGEKKSASKNVYGPPSSLSGPHHAFMAWLRLRNIDGKIIIYVKVIHLIDINTLVHRYKYFCV